MNLPDAWQNYWDRRLEKSSLHSLVQKYRALLDLAKMQPGAERNALMKDIARTWPGSLREAELGGIEVCHSRLQELRCAPSMPEPYSYWRSKGFACLPLWSDLHVMLSEQLEWKRSRLQNQKSVADFCEYLNDRSESYERYWPDEELLLSWGGPKVEPRQAYLWLAAWAQLPLPELNFHLLAREGPWDHRDSDPKWTKKETEVH